MFCKNLFGRWLSYHNKNIPWHNAIRHWVLIQSNKFNFDVLYAKDVIQMIYFSK